MQELIPLNKLLLSASNVRKTQNAAKDEQLSHDIEARGLLQNLVVTKSKKRGHYDVICGGRRLRAMTLIVARGAWRADQEVACKLLVANEAETTETSLAENFQRDEMTPAEEVQAFQHFIGVDGDTAAVAKRFGVERRFVEGRLRLAALAEPIFEQFAAGKMSIELAKAYASTDQHEVQTRVFERMHRSYGGDSPDAVRRLIADGSTRGNDSLALLVGEDAYTAAGGRIERDLFSETADDRWLDREIIEGLVNTKLQAEAERLLAETGLGAIWPVAGSAVWNVRQEMKLKSVALPPAPLSEEAQARIEAIQGRLGAICDEIEALDEESPEAAELDAEYDRLQEEMEDLSTSRMELPDEWKSEVGKFLLVTATGEMVLDSDYYSEKLLRMERDEEGNVSGGTFELPRGSGENKPSLPEATGPGGKAYSARLFDELALQRRNILAANLLNDPALALDYAIFAMAEGIARTGLSNTGTTIRAPHPQDAILSSNLPTGMAEEIMAGAFDALDKTWCDGANEVDRFMAFRELDDDTKAAWIAYTMARSLEAKKGYAAGYNPIHAQLGTLLNVEPAAMWRPTAANYFDRVSKGTILSLLQEIGGVDLSNRYASSKKTEIAVSCEKMFAGDVIVEDEIKQRALAWVPPAMRFELDADFSGDLDGQDDKGCDPDGLEDENYDDLDIDDVGDDRDERSGDLDPDINDNLTEQNSPEDAESYASA
ncbi:ParB/RepB/Spo0J family partition protein [Novosphingobium sp. TCA1]|uniref:ParB/RepB/Spo0J family partition protein n=1 Tax=Novosphingobium sp. TCA1 TaxID=2682474 RepID=UPI001306190C|nr:ParB/RepB/Spo0J family partition protein [Novosphingobium sp. TCA1]GFE77130.1 DNA-binding protein [Novosphingobium sp. TCA1]